MKNICKNMKNIKKISCILMSLMIIKILKNEINLKRNKESYNKKIQTFIIII